MSYNKELTFGLDLGDRSLKVLQLSAHGKTTHLRKFGEITLSKDVASNGVPINEEALARAIREVLRKAGIVARNVIAALPEAKTFLKLLNITKNDATLFETQLRQLIELHIPLSLDEVWWDHQIVNDHELTSEVLLAAAPKTLTASYTSVLRRAGLTPVALDLEPLSIARALIGAPHKDQVVLIADLGATKVTLIAATSYTVLFTADGGISSDALSERIASELHIEPGNAEQMKKQLGVGNGAPQPYQAVIKVYLDQLVTGLQRAIAYTHEDGGARPAIALIMLTGGGSLLSGLPEYLTNTLKIKTILGDPWINTKDHIGAQIPPTLAPRFSTVSGLALAALRHDVTWLE